MGFIADDKGVAEISAMVVGTQANQRPHPRVSMLE